MKSLRCSWLLVASSLPLAAIACSIGQVNERATPSEQDLSDTTVSPETLRACTFNYKANAAPFGAVSAPSNPPTPAGAGLRNAAPSLKLADIDGDGKTDAVLVSGADEVKTYLGKGD